MQARKWLDTDSAFYDGPVEGVYFRIDQDMLTPPSTSTSSPQDTPPYCVHRGKLVRPDFLQGIEEQWTRKQFQKNIVKR